MPYCWRVCLAWHLSDISLLEKNYNKLFSFVYMVTFSLRIMRKFSLGETKRNGDASLCLTDFILRRVKFLWLSYKLGEISFVCMVTCKMNFMRNFLRKKLKETDMPFRYVQHFLVSKKNFQYCMTGERKLTHKIMSGNLTRITQII